MFSSRRYAGGCLVGEIRNAVLAPSPGNLISCGQPIIAMVALESETARVIGEAGCGIVVQPGDGEGICSSILRLKEDASLREAMGSNGRRYLERHMSLEKNVALYEEIFCTLAGGEGLARRPIPSRSEEDLPAGNGVSN